MVAFCCAVAHVYRGNFGGAVNNPLSCATLIRLVEPGDRLELDAWQRAAESRLKKWPAFASTTATSRNPQRRDVELGFKLLSNRSKLIEIFMDHAANTFIHVGRVASPKRNNHLRTAPSSDVCTCPGGSSDPTFQFCSATLSALNAKWWKDGSPERINPEDFRKRVHTRIT